MVRKYIPITNIKKALPRLVLLSIAMIVAIGFWIYLELARSSDQHTTNDLFTTQSLSRNNEWDYCLDIYDYLDTDHISYYDGYTKPQLMSKNMQDLSTIIIQAKNNDLPVHCPTGKVCDLNQDNLIDSGDLWFLEQLLRDADNDARLIQLLVADGLPVVCDR